MGLEKGADPDFEHSDKSALSILTGQGWGSGDEGELGCELLLAQRPSVDLNSKDKSRNHLCTCYGGWNGDTPLNKAVYRDNLKVVRLLVDAGADLNIPEKDGWTPLMMSAWNGNLEIMNMLIFAGADLSFGVQKNADYHALKKGDTALQIAEKGKHTECAMALKSAQNEYRTVTKFRNHVGTMVKHKTLRPLQTFPVSKFKILRPFFLSRQKFLAQFIPISFFLGSSIITANPAIAQSIRAIAIFLLCFALFQHVVQKNNY